MRLALAAAALVALALPSSAAASGNTGWPCSPPGALVPVAPGVYYHCHHVTRTWWLYGA